MWHGLDRLGLIAYDAGLAAMVLWASASAVMLACRQPARRLRLARAACVGACVLVPLVGLGLTPRFDLVAGLHGLGVWPVAVGATGPGHWAVDVEGVDGTGRADETTPWWPVRYGSRSARLLTGLYLAGVALGLGRLALGCVAVAWLTGLSRPASLGSRTLYQSLPILAKGRRPILRVTGRVRRPSLLGVTRPLILIPPELDRPEARDRLRLSLLHELAHAEGRDPAFGFLLNVVRAVWFVLPPVWWVGDRVRLDQEFLADRRAADAFGPPRAYAASLLDLATTGGGVTGPASRFDPGGGGVEASPLVQRVLMLLRCPFAVETRPPLWWSWGLPALTALMTLAAACLTVRPPTPVRPFDPPPRTFRMARLDLAPASSGVPRRSPSMDLPVRLPERFDLSLEVWGDRSTLSRTRVVGLAVGSPGQPVTNESDLPSPQPAWHLVRVRRDAAGVALWVDGQVSPEPLPAAGLTPWLSVEPAPDRPGYFQRLNMIW